MAVTERAAEKVSMSPGARSNDGVDRPIVGLKPRLNPQRASALLAAGLACPSPGSRECGHRDGSSRNRGSAAEMLFVQCDDMVKDLAPATSHPSFSDPILPGHLDTRSLGLQTGGFQECNNLGVKLRIVVKDDVAIRAASGNASRSCRTTHSAVGSRVTLKCRIFRRPCSMTKKQ
jgi:hypothetical protein